MKAIVVGSSRVENKGYVLFLTYEPRSTAIEGNSVCTIFSKEYRPLGYSLYIACRRTSDGFKYYERTKA